MKKFVLIAVTTALALSSCSNDQEFDSIQTKNKEIDFRSFIDKGTQSRATVTTGENILGFTVTGWWDRTGNNDITNAANAGDEYLFNAFDINRREEGVGTWSYSPKRYWPAADIIEGGISFFAYSPASSKNVTKDNGLYNYKGNELEYTVPDPSRTEAQEDFLLARTGALKTDKPVELNFAHALSRVRFFARTTQTNLTYVVGGVEMIGLQKTGRINMENIPDKGIFSYNDISTTSTPVIHWTPTGTTSDLGIDIGESPINLLGTSGSKYHSLQGETNALMVLPQKINNFQIKVYYKAYLNNPEGTYFAGSKDKYEERSFTVTDNLRNGDFPFEIGRQYNFCLQFGDEVGDEITFSVEVGDWTDNAPIYTPELTDYSSLISDDFKSTNTSVISFVDAKGNTLSPALLLDSDGNTKISKEELRAVVGIIVSKENFDFKGLEYFENLEFLETNKNMTNIDASKNAKLTVAKFYGNSTLGTVNLSNTALETINFGTPTFENLNLSNTKIKGYGSSGEEINLGAATVTGTLNLSNCGLTTITTMPTDAAKVPAMLDLSHNNFGKCTIPDCQLNTLDISNNPSLTDLIFKPKVAASSEALGSKIKIEKVIATGNKSLKTVIFENTNYNGIYLKEVDIRDSQYLEKFDVRFSVVDKLIVWKGYTWTEINPIIQTANSSGRGKINGIYAGETLLGRSDGGTNSKN
ncbi:uncharacterized protein YjbI with pentapeptide repeats [Parabacteroides sp. PM5-20]|uniref:fimbrillin family protein n=1 Tax=Parabacteroides sp. PM5-20 TaxID=2940527 RepID=UPI0024769FF1|nr:fimbrillin family protein [Parabacteroides sp. PM5-20]MDH6535548.1 uncharacterized protein YjbI with pentapeptide repeats [Parabacteroides sp. PM5-20]